jgi:putative ABC transport system substrate-binding protein
MTTRRAFVLATIFGFLGTPLAADAQPARIYRVAFVSGVAPVSEMVGPEPSHPITRMFVRELRALGYVEGQNLVLERRSAEGHPERLPAIMAELIRLPVDVIVTGANTATRAAKQATNTIPIVMGISSFPVELGFAASLARPGGNVTGLTWNAGPEIFGKWLELLKEAAPGASRVAVIHQTPQFALPLADQYKETQAAARALGVTLLSVVVEDPGRLPDTLAAITRERADALIVAGSAWNFTYRHHLVDLAAKSRLPTIYSDREYVTAGGFMSYGISVIDLIRRAAHYVDKILKGAKPADLPVEQPTKFELVMNLKTAKAIGLTIPPSVLARADELIGQ